MVEEQPGAGPGLELVVLVGLQAAGKSTFYGQLLSRSHVLVSKDLFPRARRRQRRQLRLINEALSAGRSVVVDNTNPSPAEWHPLIAAGRAHGARVVAYWFPPDVPESLRRNAERPRCRRVPAVGVYATLGKLRMPREADGFDAIHEVRPNGHGGFRTHRTPAPPEPP